MTDDKIERYAENAMRDACEGCISGWDSGYEWFQPVAGCPVHGVDTAEFFADLNAELASMRDELPISAENRNLSRSWSAS